MRKSLLATIFFIGLGMVSFCNNAAVVNEPDTTDRFSIVENGKIGFIDHTGTIVVKPQFDFEEVSSFHEGLARVKIDGKYGYIDKNGTIVIPPKFESTEMFQGGLARIRVGGLFHWQYGFIDKEGNIAIEPKFDYAGYFSEGLAAVKVGEKYGFIDKNGTFVIQPQFSHVDNFSEGISEVRINEKSRFFAIYIDKQGNRIWSKAYPY